MLCEGAQPKVMIAIKDLNGQTRVDVEINQGSIRRVELMKEDYIMLRFSLVEPLRFEIGDYVNFTEYTSEYPMLADLGKFELTEPYSPTFNQATGGYDYELQLDAFYIKWQNKKFKFYPWQKGSEAPWTLTDKLQRFCNILLDNLYLIGYRSTEKGVVNFELREGIENTDEMITLYFDNTSILDAINMMAQAVNNGKGCDWWFEGATLCFGKCSNGERLNLTLHDNVENISRSEGENTYTTRLYAYGSEENIPRNYRKQLKMAATEVTSTYFVDASKKFDRFMFNDTARLSGSDWRSDIAINGTTAVTNKTVNGSEVTQAYALFNVSLNGNSYGEYAIDDEYLGASKQPTKFNLQVSNFPISKLKADVSVKAFIETGTDRYEAGRGEDEIDADIQNGQASVSFEPGITPLRFLANIPPSTQARIRYEVTFNCADITEEELAQATFELTMEGNTQMLKYAGAWETKIVINNVEKTARMTNSYSTADGAQTTRFFILNNGAVVDPDILEGTEWTFAEGEINRAKVPNSYFEGASGSDSTNVSVVKRLRLPDCPLFEDEDGELNREGNGTLVYDGSQKIDAEPELPMEQIIEDVQYFNDIKPTYEGKIPVGKIGCKVEDEKDDQGKKTGDHVYNYVFLDTKLKNFSNKNSLANGNMKVTFKSGKCNGLTFEVEKFKGRLDNGLRPNGTSEQGTWLRVVPNEDYATRLPNNYLYPEAGDEYNMSGYDTSFISDVLIYEAENLLFKTAKEYLDGVRQDQSTDTLTLMSDWSKTNGIPALGRKVKLQAQAFYSNTGKTTRVIGFEYYLDIPYDSPKIICGETSAYSRIRELEQKINS